MPTIEEALNTLRNAKKQDLDEIMRRIPLGEVASYEDQISNVLNLLGGQLESLHPIREYVPQFEGEEKPPRPKEERGVVESRTYETRRYDQSELHIQPGDTIRVPRGTLIETDAPGEKVVQAKRGKKVSVRGVNPGSETSPPTVMWHGSGGYRREADINDVEKIQ